MNRRDCAVSKELSRAIERVLSPLIDEGSVAGAVVSVADRDCTLAQVAAGFSDIGGNKPMESDALFWVASQTKPVTATALMMLVDEGKVDLDDPISSYLPEFETMWVIAQQDENHKLLVKANRRITVRDILSHLSGIPFSSEFEGTTRDLRDLAVRVRSYSMEPLLSQPGTRYEYSSAGINVAGRIIEVVSGLPFEQFLQVRLFDPLGMRDTTFRPSPTQLARLAKTYQPNASATALEETPIPQLHYPLDSPIRRPMAGGGLFSTAQDMTAFCRMILNDGSFGGRDYVTPDAIARMSTRQVPHEMVTPEGIFGSRKFAGAEGAQEADEASYGLGWGIREDSFEHGGALSSGMAVYPELGYVVVFHVQHIGFINDGERSRADVESAIKGVLS